MPLRHALCVDADLRRHVAPDHIVTVQDNAAFFRLESQGR